jgi:alkylation response protein AidB-like acyl-CoA dehydrogenase
MAKLTARFVTHDAFQTFGGWRYLQDYPVEPWMRDEKEEDTFDSTG